MNKPEDIVEKKSLYAARDKIYPREIKGYFQNMRSLSVIVLLGLYYIGPWLSWGDRQAILFDLPARKFHIFFLTFWPQDFFFLTLLLIIAGLTLFFFTALAGRLWCGYACPQTVWTEAFIWMERWVEGTRAQQMKLAKAPWTANKWRKKISKQLLWITFSLWTGITFVGYFMPIKPLFGDLLALQLSGWALFWCLFYGFATYGNAGFMREQVCKYMCPYARFQSAMFDKHTLIVAYNDERGEPRLRGKKRKEQESNVGDCIDCGLCVQVCPTGIDIRDGLQYECIACAACVDVCNDVMESVSLPKGLIRYSTEAIDHGDNRSLVQTLLRPRTIIYAILLTIFITGFLIALFMRGSFQVDILRDRNALYRMSNAATVENVYHVKVMNKSQQQQQYTIAVEGLEMAEVNWLKQSDDGSSRMVDAGEIGDFIATVRSPLSSLDQQSEHIQLKVSEAIGDEPQSLTEATRFWGPK